MKAEIKSRLHDIKERVIHPFGYRGHRVEEARDAVSDRGSRRRLNEEPKIDESAGSEYRED